MGIYDNHKTLRYIITNKQMITFTLTFIYTLSESVAWRVKNTARTTEPIRHQLRPRPRLRNLPSKDEVKAEFMAVTIKSMDGLVNLVANFDTSKDCRENDYLVSYCCIFETLIDIANYEYMEDG